MDVSALVRSFAKPSTSFSSHQHELMAKLCEVFKAYLKLDMIAFTTRYLDEPLIFFYSADATPVTTKDVFLKMAGDLKVRRKGRTLSEFLVQRCFGLSGDGVCKVLLTEAMPMADKTSWTHTQAYRDLVVCPRSLGHRSIVVHHFSWGRGVHSACWRQTRQLFQARAMDGGFAGTAPAGLAELLTWLTTSPCANHDAHNSLKWACLEVNANKTVLRGLFVSIESVRNGFSLLMKNVRAWLYEVVEYEDQPLFPHQVLWTLLAVDTNIAEIAEDLQLRYQGGKLKVAEKWRGDAATYDSIELVLTHIWAFRKYSDSRWLSMGPSTRCLLAAQICGTREFIEWILLKPSNSRFYLGGFLDYFTKDVARLVAVVGTSSFPADAALANLMDDPRLAMNVDSLEADVMQEVSYAHSLPAAIWELLASRCMWDGFSLRHAGMSSSLTSASFVFWRLRYVRALPWTLVRGDVDKNLDDLMHGSKPSEETSAKIWQLLKISYPRAEIKAALRLMGNASFSTEVVEKGHSFASNIMKRHREYGEESLRCRSMVASVRPLVELDHVAKHVMRAEMQLERLARRRPQNFTGRQLYLQQLSALAGHWAKSGKRVAKDISKTLVRQHGAAWRNMSLDRRHALEARAADARLAVEAEIESKRAKINQEVLVLRARQTEAAVRGLPPLQMSSARWGQEQLLEVGQLFESNTFSKSKVAELRRQCRAAIGPPPREVKAYIASMRVAADHPQTPRPPWLGLVCRQRAFFGQCVFKFVDDDDDAVYVRPTFIRQSPFVVGFVKLACKHTLGDCCINHSTQRSDAMRHKPDRSCQNAPHQSISELDNCMMRVRARHMLIEWLLPPMSDQGVA